MSDVRAILFDVFGTVVDWRGSVISELAAWGAAHGVEADWAGLADAWRGAYAPSMDEVRRGARPWTVLDDLHRASLAALLPQFGVPAQDAATMTHLAHSWRRLQPWPDSVAGLQQLRRQRVVAALSNGNVALLVAMARHAGLPWDMVFGADLWRHYKPDPETYLGACGLLGLPPESVMLAAAHPTDLAAAQRFGLRTAFIARPLECGPLEHRPAKHGTLSASDPGGQWDFAVGSITELADRLA
jgi:2-haloacid dehalogenase